MLEDRQGIRVARLLEEEASELEVRVEAPRHRRAGPAQERLRGCVVTVLPQQDRLHVQRGAVVGLLRQRALEPLPGALPLAAVRVRGGEAHEDVGIVDRHLD